MNIPNPLHDWLRALPGFSANERESGGPLDLIGLDMAPSRREISKQTWVPAIAAIVLAALLLAGLRMNIIRLRYDVATGLSLEQELLAEKRDMTVSLLRLREPKLLSELAVERGFATPGRVINLYAPSTIRPASQSPQSQKTSNAPDSAGAGLQP